MIETRFWVSYPAAPALELAAGEKGRSGCHNPETKHGFPRCPPAGCCVPCELRRGGPCKRPPRNRNYEDLDVRGILGLFSVGFLVPLFNVILGFHLDPVIDCY
ncbi:hypothetical protein NDU88_001005 [Pleurodeles waltl]|uniref:Uncharacterized protein n=1 Tax=Pleurodeles waltl TaxID=8319 RepID=A0AAV7SY19_PLEWA|nr:hypothetical protein NDU88_001005 [Pleurodeles waltl]